LPPASITRASFEAHPALSTIAADTNDSVSGLRLLELPNFVDRPIPGIINTAHMLSPLHQIHFL
jgi:hypothetical protein